MSELARLQRLFHDRVTSGVEASELFASGHVTIYENMYASRLRDSLAEDFPKLHSALGDDAVGKLVTSYLRTHPPGSHTLSDLGLALPGYLQSHVTAEWPAWASALAALESARNVAFTGPDAAPLQEAKVAELGARLPELVIAWGPTSAVVSASHAVDALWSDIEDGQEWSEPDAAPCTVLVWRRDTTVVHRTLDADEATLAHQLVDGASFAQICEVLTEMHEEQAAARAVALLRRWLQAQAIVEVGYAR